MTAEKYYLYELSSDCMRTLQERSPSDDSEKDIDRKEGQKYTLLSCVS